MPGNISKKLKGRRSASLTINIGPELLDILENYCEATGQSKTTALERAIKAYCDGDEISCGEGER